MSAKMGRCFSWASMGVGDGGARATPPVGMGRSLSARCISGARHLREGDASELHGDQKLAPALLDVLQEGEGEPCEGVDGACGELVAVQPSTELQGAGGFSEGPDTSQAVHTPATLVPFTPATMASSHRTLAPWSPMTVAPDTPHPFGADLARPDEASDEAGGVQVLCAGSDQEVKDDGPDPRDSIIAQLRDALAEEKQQKEALEEAAMEALARERRQKVALEEENDKLRARVAMLENRLFNTIHMSLMEHSPRGASAVPQPSDFKVPDVPIPPQAGEPTREAFTKVVIPPPHGQAVSAPPAHHLVPRRPRPQAAAGGRAARYASPPREAGSPGVPASRRGPPPERLPERWPQSARAAPIPPDPPAPGAPTVRPPRPSWPPPPTGPLAQNPNEAPAAQMHRRVQRPGVVRALVASGQSPLGPTRGPPPGAHPAGGPPLLADAARPPW